MKAEKQKSGFTIIKIGALLVVLNLTACLAPNIKTVQLPSYSYPAQQTQHTNLGQSISKQTNNHKNLSGYYVLSEGLPTLATLRQLVEKTSRSLDLQYYIYHDDKTGRLFADSVLKAADRGVRVRILLDDIFSSGSAPLMKSLNDHANIQVRLFHPVTLYRWLKPLVILTDFSRINRRMHNKAFIADNQVAIVGGRNIGDAYFMAEHKFLFTDVDVLSVGPIVKDISTSYDTYWNSRWAIPISAFTGIKKFKTKKSNIETTRVALALHAKTILQSSYGKALLSSTLGADLIKGKLPLLWAKSKVLVDPPEKIVSYRKRNPRFLSERLKPYLHQAKSEVRIITPYYIPQKGGMRWIKKLRARGVEVSILTNSFASNDVGLAHTSYQRYRKKLLKLGVRLYEFKSNAFRQKRQWAEWFKTIPRESLHVKTIIIDNKYVVMGSANLSPRSKYLNTEIVILIESPGFANRALALFDKLSNPSNSFKLALWRNKRNENEGISWSTLSPSLGEYIQYKREPDTWIIPHIGFTFLGIFPLEDLL